MKYRFPRPPLPAVPRTSAMGFLLSTLGLLSGSFGLGKLVQSLLGTPVSMATVITTLLVGLVLSATGFLLLVAAADPFEESDCSADPSMSGDKSPQQRLDSSAEQTRLDHAPTSSPRRRAG